MSFALVAATRVDDNGLSGQRDDEVAVGHLVDVPRTHAGQLCQLGALVGLGLGLLGEDHQVLHAERLHVRHALGVVVVVIPQLADRIGAVAADRRRRDEVVWRRAAGFEEQTLHAGDAAIGPVRQQHQRHGRSVLTVVAVVLPHRPAAAMVCVGAERLHLIDQRLVLAVGIATLVAHEVVPGPTVALRVLGRWRERDGVEIADAPGVHVLAVLRDDLSAGHLLEEEQLHHQHDDADRRCRWRARPSTCCRCAPAASGYRARPPRRARRCRPSSASVAAGTGTAAGEGSTADR